MSDHQVTTHNRDYTFIEFIGDLLDRVGRTRSLNQELTVELPQGHAVTLRVQIVDAALANEVSDSVH
jgi:hypothetical protein